MKNSAEQFDDRTENAPDWSPLVRANSFDHSRDLYDEALIDVVANRSSLPEQEALEIHKILTLSRMFTKLGI